ncbi:MAG: NADH-quinone oxidoreductase subunit J [Deltaproteobacteria bacterium]|jgi:NADH-quinone oxidoreductase subunit J|nr:NADH-quinone oxidoreductase subunit J [Deltaproteobacteria bacterium]MBT4526148.1 NADH-quinone oxidoreductase subunit J [Deltaproteobacteria bacterium]
MEIADLFFYLFSVMIIGLGGVVAFSRNLLHSAFALFFVLFGVAGFYVLLGADFLAMVQIMVYAGGVCVLLIFATMLSDNISQPGKSNLSFQTVLSTVAGGGIALLLLSAFENTTWNVVAPGAMEPTTNSIGKLLLNEYILPFEVISFLLLAAMVSAIMLVKKGENS